MIYQHFGETDGSWAGRTASEITSLAAESGSILVVPVGSLEQHGKHLPVATDTILVDAVVTESVKRVAGDLPVLALPPVWTGYSPHHLPFGGTISLDNETLLHVLEEIADSALESGFDALLLVNGHGGNKSLVDAATSAIGVTHPDHEILGLTYFELAQSFVDDIRESDSGGMAHGGEFETSLLMHLRPDLVREDSIEGEYPDEPYERASVDLVEGGSLSVYRPFTAYSSSGVIGDPELASAEKGAQIFDQLCEALADIIQEIHDQTIAST
ncbi:creatininase family protein [Halomicrococcus sp. SG-WS-1]|uniref:creatininase family protein n=1 Tax=Halomicrococcus sp. SG-WS-1 TaxID=3439057 RepID=UPI003F79431C